MNFRILLILTFCSINSFSQNYILCRKNTKTYRILEGTTLSYAMSQDTALIQGTLVKVLDSSVVIEIDTILISKIAVIEIPRENFGVRLLHGLGRELPKAGVYYLALGTLNSWIFNYPPLFSWRRTLIAASISATGFLIKGVAMLADSKTFNSRKWSFRAMSFDQLAE